MIVALGRIGKDLHSCLGHISVKAFLEIKVLVLFIVSIIISSY